MMEDKLLVWQCKRGSGDALRQIYEKYHVDLLRLAIVLTGEANAAQDIVHDVFVRFAQSVRRLSLTGSLKGYLVASTVNRVRDHRRNTQRRSGQGLEDATTALPSPSRSPEQWAILSEQLEHLSRAMAQLPYEQREAVALHVQGGLTFRRIARRQNTSVSTAQGRYRYGIEKLRSLLNGELSP
jgi:RNA polymerase sigma-70 factor (ECF subfamily)